MQLDTHVQALQAELASLASIGDEQVAAAAERLSQALASSLRLRLLELLSEAALEVGYAAALGPRRGPPRRAGALARLRRARGGPAPPAGEDGLSARITLRLPDSLKTSVEAAASARGRLRQHLDRQSAGPRALRRDLRRHPRIGSRLTGYGQS